MKKLKLSREEKAWLQSYRKALKEQYPAAVSRLLLYGSKDRGHGE
jgi:hypothetical protein